jgi:hypothetical protein
MNCQHIVAAEIADQQTVVRKDKGKYRQVVHANIVDDFCIDFSSTY